MSIIPSDSNLAEEQDLTYAEMYDSLVLNTEIIFTIPSSEEERTKIGLKNYKARLNMRQTEEGIPIDKNIFVFTSTPSEDFPDCIDFRVVLKKPAAVPVKKIVIPEQLPD